MQWGTGTMPHNNHTAQFELWFENPAFGQGSSTWSWQQTEGNSAILSAIYPWHIIWQEAWQDYEGRDRRLWNQLKQCFIVIYALHLHKPNRSQTFLFLPFPEYIASLQVFYITGDSPCQTHGDSIAFSPWHVKPCQNNPILLPRPLLQNFGGVFFVCFNQLHPTSGFPRILHICLTSPSWHTIKVGWSLFWSTISSRYLFNKWNKVMQCSEHGKRVKALFITNYRAVASWSGPAMATV